MDFQLSGIELNMFLVELAYFGDLIQAFQDCGTYEDNPAITRATHQIKTGLKDLKSSLEAETVGHEPVTSMILDLIRKGRKHEH